MVVPGGGAISYERGTPVRLLPSRPLRVHEDANAAGTREQERVCERPEPPKYSSGSRELLPGGLRIFLGKVLPRPIYGEAGVRGMLHITMPLMYTEPRCICLSKLEEKHAQPQPSLSTKASNALVHDAFAA